MPDKTATTDILLTTFPSEGTRNVGDQLITESAIKLIKFRVPDYSPEIVFREEPLERFSKEDVRTILAPGFSVTDDVYPGKFKLYEDLDPVVQKVFPVGCSFQHWLPLRSTYDTYSYGEKTISLLKKLAANEGALPCRDELISEMLNRHGVPATYCGDLALYDDEVVGTRFEPPAKVKSIAVTIQHKRKFFGQSRKLLDLIRRDFSEADLYVVHHSVPTEGSKDVAEYAKSIGFIEKDLSGSVENLNFYDDIDLHIGYRLHGHIAFLRRRKPSVLIVEDARSFGISQSGDLRIGTFSSVLEDGATIDKDAPGKAIKFIRLQAKKEFAEYQKVFSFIDESYKASVRPYFDRFSKRLGWSKMSVSYFKSILSTGRSR